MHLPLAFVSLPESDTRLRGVPNFLVHLPFQITSLNLEVRCDSNKNTDLRIDANVYLLAKH